MHILFDFDDVIVDTTALKRVAAQWLFGVTGEGDLKSMLSVEQYQAVQSVVYDGVLSRVHIPKPFALETIRSLQHSGHRVRIITARTGGMCVVAREFLRRHGITAPVIGVGYGKDKSTHTRTADVFVDDDPVHVTSSLARMNILFVSGRTGSPTGVCATSWVDIQTLIGEMADNRP